MSIHANRGKSIAQTITDSTDYIENPDKTRDREFVTSYACDVRTVDSEFLLAKRQYLHITGREKVPFGKDVLAYHIRQAFRPGEITPEKANEIGRELALRFTKGEHAFIVATHIDRRHIHNHIIFNSTNLDCDRKFDDFLGSAKAIRRLSDFLCVENGLSIVENPKPSKGKNYHKWLGADKKPSFQDVIREAIDKALAKNPVTFDDLLRLLDESNIQVIRQGKHIKFMAPGQKKPTRCDTLKGDYTEAAIRKRIDGKRQRDAAPTSRFAAGNAPSSTAPSLNLLIDVENSIKAKDSPGYERWAKVFNLKQAAQTLIMLQENNITEYDQLAQRAEQAAASFNEFGGIIRGIDARLTEISELQKHIGNYSKTRDVYAAYRAAKFSKKYKAEHEQEIQLHREAKQAFDALGFTKIPSIKALRQEYATLLADKKKLYKEYNAAKTDMRDYITARSNVDRLLNYHAQEEQTKHDPEK